MDHESDGDGLSAVEPIALHIRKHQNSLTDWPYAGLARALHSWVEIFNLEFNLQLPQYPVLMFAPLRGAYATYQSGRSAFGSKDNITFNIDESYLDRRLLPRTLLHELLHMVQAYRGRPSGSNYHNAEFRQMAARCGLVVDSTGYTLGHTEVFTRVLAGYGVHLEPSATQTREVKVRATATPKIRLWECGCTIIRCATNLAARCEICGQPSRLRQ